jgi:hypothetical protein
MRPITSALAATAVAVLLTSAVAAAQGQVTDNRLTNVTFSAPVSVPGHTLAPGTYHFQLLDSQTDRNIVQIFDKDNHLVATLMAVPAKRNEPEGDPVITFKETRSNMPPAVHYWYYAGESSGSELVYPKSQAMEIARASGEPVMATDAESSDASALKNSKISRVNPDNANAQAPTTQPDTTTAPRQTSQPTSTPVTTAPTTPTTTTEQAPTQPTTAPKPTTTTTTAPQPTTPTTTAERPTTQPTTTPDVNQNATRPQTVGTSGRRAAKSLPKTASNLPEIGLIGLIALSAGLGIRVARKALV